MAQSKLDLLQGTLDVMVLQTLAIPWAHCMGTGLRDASSR